MPTYEYRCPNGHDFEHFVRTMSASESEMRCPDCGETGLRRMSGGSALLFKGSGFYITDYGKDGKKDQRKASGAASDGGGESGAKPAGDQGASGAKPSGDTGASGAKPSGDQGPAKGPAKGPTKGPTKGSGSGE